MTLHSDARVKVVLCLLAAQLLGCGGNEVIHLQLGEGTCSTLPKVRAVQASATSSEGTELSACIAVSPKSLAEVQAALTGKIAFRDQSDELLTVKVQGYDSVDCKRKVLLCARDSFTASASPSTIVLPVLCHEGADPPAEFTACTAP